MAEDTADGVVWRLKKAEGEAIFGPVDKETLKSWADSAQISPMDEVDRSDEEWKKAPEIDFLEMNWKFPVSDGVFYGPTTIGAIHEFLAEGVINPKTEVIHARTNESGTVTMLLPVSLAKGKPAPARVEISANEPVNSSESGQIIVEVAKDQRIRQLEEDLRALRKEHEDLVHKFRKSMQPGGKSN